MAKPSTATTLSEATQAAALGKLIFESSMFKDVTATAQAAVKVLAGMELGIGPVQAMSGLHVIQGKVVLSAALMASLILRSNRYSYEVTEHDETACVIEFFREGKLIGVSSFSMDDAGKAGLASSPTWKNYPRNMLFARAVSNGARWYCPDVFCGAVYTPDELSCDEIDEQIEDGQEAIEGEFEMVADSELTKHPTLLVGMIQETGTDEARLLTHYGVSSLGDLTKEQQQQAIQELSTRPKNKPPN